MHELRLEKQTARDSNLRIGEDLILTPAEVEHALGPVIDMIWDVYLRAFQDAYRKEPRSSHWRELQIVLVGGGSLAPGVKQRFLRDGPNNIVEKILAREMKLSEFQTDGIRESAGLDEYAPLLTVGFGISFPRAEIPDYWKPIEVEPLPPPRPPLGKDIDPWRE